MNYIVMLANSNYDVYLRWINMSYDQFMAATTEIATKFVLLFIALAILLGWYIYTVIIFLKGRLKRDVAKKFKKICKWEHRSPIEQEKYIIEKFIDEYTEEHGIIWKK